MLLVGVAVWIWMRREPTPKYNVVVITMDTTRADRIGCYGADFARTPTIDALAKNGVLYKRCYAPAPITLPSHASLLTGLYPFRHGIRNNGEGRLADNAVTLQEILRDAGFKTGAVIGAFVLDSQFGLEQGFDFYEDDMSQGTQRKFAYAERKAEAVTDQAIQWLQTIGDSRYFLWAHYFDPHFDYAPPGVDTRPLIGSREGLNRLYDLEISYTDSQLGRLLAHVRKIEEATGRPTLVVLTSDHAESLDEHREPTHGMFIYNATQHVPLIIADSLGTAAGTVVDSPVSLVDVMPTVLKKLDLELPYEIDGRVLPQSAGTDNRGSDESSIYMESLMPWNLYRWSPLEGVIVGDFKLIAAPQPELYDLANDPGELNNLYVAGDPKVLQLADALEDLKFAELDIPDLTATEMDLDEEEIRQLASLGYLSTDRHRDDSSADLADPKAVFHQHRQLLSARSLIVRGKIAKAFDELRAVIEEDPHNSHSYNTIVGMVIESSDQVPAEQAIPLMRHWLEKNPDVNTAVALGILYERTGDVGNALTAYNRGVELDGNDLTALNNSAWFLYKTGGDLELALKRSENAINVLLANPDLKGTPTEGSARHTMACILLALDRPADAIEHLESATKLVPNFAAAFYHLGVARQTIGDNDLALKLLQHSVKLAGSTEPDWLADAKARIDQDDK